MEDKHIYSTSFLDKLKDRFNAFSKEIQNIVQDLIPKRIPKKPPAVFVEEKPASIPQTPVTVQAIKTSYKKPKNEKAKKVKTNTIHYKKIADESIQKMLVIGLSTIIIAIFGLGIFLTYKDSLYPQPHQKTQNKQYRISTTPTPYVTTNWKTYSNNQYYFLFKYPPDYELQESNLGNGDFKVFLIMDPTEQTARGITVMKNKSLSETINEIKTNQYQGEQIIEEKSITVDNNEAKFFVVNTVKGPTKAQVVIVEKYNNVYRFDWLDSQILSTFKFIEYLGLECSEGEYLKQCKLGQCCCPEGAMCD